MNVENTFILLNQIVLLHIKTMEPNCSSCKKKPLSLKITTK